MELVSSSVRMNGGENSYANNSILQRRVIFKTRLMVEESIMRIQEFDSFPEQCFAIADMGCSSGPNTLLSLSTIIHAILRLSPSPPELQVFLNDLPSNDFNSVFSSLPDFYRGLVNQKGAASVSCYVSGTPGSFYGRLFPTSTLHFVHSSYSLHWLSQVPPGIENNKGNIHIGGTSPPNVSEAYNKQFQIDFSKFLSSRAKEIKTGGGMILAFIGKSEDPTCTNSALMLELLSKSLIDMVEEGMIEEDKVDSFNMPSYYPSKGEVKDIIERQGSFTIHELGSFEINWDGTDSQDYGLDKISGQNVASIMRAAFESLIASHFGEGVIQDLFARYAKHISDHISVENTKHINIVVSMTKN